jgi:hypothetical protein
MNNNQDQHQLFSVKFYVKIFFILLAMIFVNMAIAHLPLPNEVITFLLIVVATIQSVIVCLFFMELIHEDKFYMFIWGGAVLFMILFFIITLLELHGRGAFDKYEDIHYMRKIDKGDNYAPAGPEMLKKKDEKMK